MQEYIMKFHMSLSYSEQQSFLMRSSTQKVQFDVIGADVNAYLRS